MLIARTPLGRAQHEPVQQPLEFDHRHHAGDDGIDCRYCHEGAWSGPVAGVPPIERCMGCHAQVWNDSPQLEALRDAWASKKPLVWNRVHRLADFAFFDHSAHVNHGIGCSTCHGRVDQMAEVEQVAPINMGWCLDCHRDPSGKVRPLDRVTEMGWSPHEGEGALPAVAPRTECATCHR
ncbi:MAG: cytochrome c3 family protein [Myxococcaceae bacterium]